MSQLNLAVQEALRVLRAEANAQHNLIDVRVDLDDVENAIAALSAVEEKVRLFDGVPMSCRFAFRTPRGRVAFSSKRNPTKGASIWLRKGDYSGLFIYGGEELTFICERAS